VNVHVNYVTLYGNKIHEYTNQKSLYLFSMFRMHFKSGMVYNQIALGFKKVMVELHSDKKQVVVELHLCSKVFQ